MKKYVAIVILTALSLGCGEIQLDRACSEETAKTSRQEVASLSESREKGRESPWGEVSITQHTIEAHGKSLGYTATAGFIPLKDKAGKSEADIFFVAYTKDGAQSQRPITFAFNGGPGASSVWLHLCAIGPKRVLLEEYKALPPPYALVDNEYTWLDSTDLVFVDPVGTGYSHAALGVDAKKFFGVEADVRTVGQFIRLYVTLNDRWLSPKFLVGESYGTTRAAALTGYLQDELGMNLNGIVLISAALNFQNIPFVQGNDFPYILYLPAYALAACYHKRLSPELQADFERTRNDVEAFALNDYLPALAKGDTISPEERGSVIEKLTSYTSLSGTYIRNHNLRINRNAFLVKLLRKENLRIGVLDSRVTGDYTANNFMEDPSVFVVIGPLTATWNAYVRDQLKFETEIPYVVLSEKVNKSWDWGSASRGYLNVADILARSMHKNKSLRVLIASGYYDLDTSYFATQYTVSHLDIPPDLRKNITLTHFHAGHQLYVHIPSLVKLSAIATEFFKTSVSGRRSDRF
jgi:carboxypeptidase C (cathepsin A)